MHATMFETPLIRTFLRLLSTTYLKLTGWKVQGSVPPYQRYVLIGAPHTSNWDVPIALAVCFALGIRPYWMGKNSLFRWPFGGIMRWSGGLPIDRSKANNIVAASVQAFQERERLVMIIPPEGTRKQVTYWKTGFYHIAHGAGVPVVMGFVDFKNKTAGIGPTLWTTGNIDTDMRSIQNFYAPITGKYPDQFNTARMDPGKTSRPAA